MLSDWLTSIGAGGLKPVLAEFVLPPVPLLALALAGAWQARARPRLARTLVALACVALWLASCSGAAEWIERHALDEPPALGPAERAALKAEAAAGGRAAIVVLGGGVDRSAPEFGESTLAQVALARLRYGVWLSRETGIPLAASGGRGWAATGDGTPEAEVMARAAQSEFGHPLRWVEARSRDTRENAANTVALLRPAGVRTIVVVTSGWHLPRALRDFRRAADDPALGGGPGAPALRLVAAPTGQAYPDDRAVLAWMPSGEGALRMRHALRELLARSAGA
jgi:uncharacterized SAM-binding protein YcdF (DUF218 family)